MSSPPRATEADPVARFQGTDLALTGPGRPDRAPRPAVALLVACAVACGNHGFAGRRVVHLYGTKTPATVRFIAVDDQHGRFGDAACTAAEGILGLGPATMAPPGTDTVIDQLTGAGMPKTIAVQQCDHAGQLWLGGFDRTRGGADPTYAPLLPIGMSHYEYDITVADVQLGGKSLAAASSFAGDTVLDTGSPQIELPTDACNALVAEVTATDAYATIFGTQPFFDANKQGTGDCVYLSDDVAATIDTTLPHRR